jgi:hypothetical protein
MSCPHDHVGPGDASVGICFIVVNQGAPRCLNMADTTSGSRFGRGAYVRICDAFIAEQFNGPFAGIDQLNESRPVKKQGGLGRPAESGPEFLQGLLGPRRGNVVTEVDPGQGVCPVDPLWFLGIHGKTTAPG